MIAVSLLFFSCGQESPFLPVSSMGDAVSLGVSVPPGRVIDPESQDSIDIDFAYDEANVIPGRLEITLLNSRGSAVGETVVMKSGDLDGELPSIDTTSLEDGLYYVRLRFYDSSGQLLKESVTPFFNSRAAISIKGIDVYPPEFSPLSSGFLFPDVDAPGTSWIRWSLGSSVISEGTLESYKSGLIWTAPGEEGVYTLKMEVFPFAPVSGSYDFSSSLYTDVQIFVTDSVSEDKFDLGSGGRYTVLLNLNGNLKNEGNLSAGVSFTGAPVLELKDSGFGYYFAESDGISFNRNILPSSGGVPSPFSVILRLKAEDSSFGSGVLRVSDLEGELFSLDIDGTGVFFCRMRQDGGWVSSISGIHVFDVSEIVLSAVPSDTGILFLWYADGRLASSSVSDYVPSAVSGDYAGTSVIGGNTGFTGFIDYFGVHEGPDDNIFRRMIIRGSGADTVVLAEGFDGLDVPDSIRKLNPEDSLLSVSRGNLVIPPSGEAVLFESTLDFDGLVLAADSHSPEGYYTFSLSDSFEYGSSGGAEYPVSGSVTVNADRNEGRLIISGDTGKKIFIPLNGDKYLKIGILNSDSENTYELASFLVRKKGGKVVENKVTVFGSNL